MKEDSPETLAREQRVDEVIASYMDAVTAGRTPDRRALLEGHPDLTAELEAFFAADLALRRLSGPPLAGASARDPQATADLQPEKDGSRTERGDVSSLRGRSLGQLGDYDLLAELGRGGMGVVYKARHRQLKRLVALKMILAGDHAGREAVARFRSEAEAVAHLQHPNIVQIHEIGEHDGRPYFSLEYVAGGSLAEKLAGTPLPPQEAAHLIETLACAMDHAHRHGIVHRDLKPANILLQGPEVRDQKAEVRGQKTEGRDPSTSDSRPLTSALWPKIADFGLARQLENDRGATGTGAILGTPSYMAPEQARGEGRNAGPQADVYALGAILYECLTGRPPFKGSSALETARQVMSDDPVTPSRLHPRVPRDLETICMKCLHKVPAKRYGSAQELAEDLRRFRANEPIRARPAGVLEQGMKWARRRPAVAGLLGAVVSVTAAALLVLTLAWQHAEAAWGKTELARQGEQEQRTEAEAAKERAEAARKVAENLRQQADAARQAEAEQRHKFQRLYTLQLLDRGISLGDQHDARGLHWIVRGIQNAGPDNPDLDTALRRQLAAWSGEARPLRFVLPRTYSGAGFSPDGKTLLTWGSFGAERWDAATGKPIDRLPDKAAVYHAVYSTDGSTIATAHLSGVRLWDAKTGRGRGEIRAKTVLATNILGMLAAPGGGRLALANLPLNTPATFGILPTSGEHRLLALRPNGKMLATASTAGVVQLWDVETCQPIGAPMKHPAPVLVLSFSPDGETLLTTSDRAAYLWDLTGRPIGKPMEHAGYIMVAAFSPNGKLLATASLESTARLWDGKTAEPASQPLKHGSPVRSLAFNRDGTVLLTFGLDRAARFWDVATGQQLGRPSLPHPGMVGLVAFRADGYLLTADWSDGGVRVWAESDSPIAAALPHMTKVTQALFSPDRKAIATLDGAGLVHVWEEEPVARAQAVTHGSTSYGLNGLVVGPTKDGKLQVSQVAVGRPVAPVGKRIEPRGLQSDALVSRDGRTLLTRAAADGTLRLWNVETGAETGAIADEAGKALSVTLGSDAQTILVTRGRLPATVYDVATRKPRCTLKGPAGVNFFCGALSADGQLAASGGSDGVVRLWDATTGQPLAQKLAHRETVLALAFSDDGKYLLTGGADRTARLWHVDTGTPALPPLLHGAPVGAVAITPDSKTLQTCSQDGRSQLWDAATGKKLGPSTQLLGVPLAVAFADNGKTYLARFSLRGRVPQPVPGDAQRLKLWVEVLTGMEMDDDGVFSALDGAQWQERRQRLELVGGPPL